MAPNREKACHYRGKGRYLRMGAVQNVPEFLFRGFACLQKPEDSVTCNIYHMLRCPPGALPTGHRRSTQVHCVFEPQGPSMAVLVFLCGTQSMMLRLPRHASGSNRSRPMRTVRYKRYFTRAITYFGQVAPSYCFFPHDWHLVAEGPMALEVQCVINEGASPRSIDVYISQKYLHEITTKFDAEFKEKDSQKGRGGGGKNNATAQDDRKVQIQAGEKRSWHKKSRRKR